MNTILPSPPLPFYRQALRKWIAWEDKHPRRSFLLEFSLILAIFLAFSLGALARLPVAIQWQRIPSYFWDKQAGPFLWGLVQTIRLSILSLLLASLIGYLSALMRLSRLISAQFIAWSYIQFVRNTPLLVQLYIGYFLLSPLLGMSSFQTALLVLSLFEGAYTAEIIHSAINNIAPGQRRAAHALGFHPLQIELLIIHPQALRNALPVLASQGVRLIKDSALASTIGVFELARSAQSIQEKTFLPFEPWLAVAVIYFLLTFSLSIAVRFLEKKLSQR